MMLYSKVMGEGFPVILIHGLFGMGDNLAMVARPLAEHFQVHCLDLRNHGRSPRAGSMTFPDMAGDVGEYLRANGIKRAHLLGHSLGGKVAMQLALTAPDLVEKVVVADIAPVTYHKRGHDDVFAGLLAVDLASLAARRDADSQLAEHIREEGVRQFILKNLYRDETGNFSWRINVEALYACYDQMREGIDGEPFAGDVLFIKGGDSPYIQESHRETIMRLFPNARLKILQGAGHWLHAEKPAAFNRIVLAFLLNNNNQDL